LPGRWQLRLIRALKAGDAQAAWTQSVVRRNCKDFLIKQTASGLMAVAQKA